MKRFITALLALSLTLSLCVSALADNEGTVYADYTPRALREGETLRLGIDVSQFQGEIDWKAVADSGVEFVYIRAALRGWGAEGRMMADTRFRQNVTEAKKYGILVGAYIYSQAITTDEAAEEARFLIEQVKDFELDLPLVLDLEFADQNGALLGRLWDAQLSRTEMTSICNTFCYEVERFGYTAMVYSNPYMLTTFLYPDQLGQIWLANHVTETQYQGDYVMWQCTDTGRVPGISGNVDLDFWFASDSAPQPAMRFTDVPATHWAYADLRTAVSHGWVNGYPDNTFRPSGTLTRADFVTMLARLSGDDLTVYAGTPFPDVPQEKYYAASVIWAVRSGIVSGFPDGTFRPTEPITREQMAHIMTLYLTHIGKEIAQPDGSVDSGITDLNEIGRWALADVRFCYGVGLLNGRGSRFVPAGTATRAEAATVLARLYRYANGEPAQPGVPTPIQPDPGVGVVLSLPELHIAQE